MGRARTVSAQGLNSAWLAGMKSGQASANYKAGIQRAVAAGVNPMASAATPEAMAAYRDGVIRSIDSGKRAAALAAAPPTRWSNNAMTVGASALTTGASKAAEKHLAASQKLAGVLTQASAAAAAADQSKTRDGAKARFSAAIDTIMEAYGR